MPDEHQEPTERKSIDERQKMTELGFIPVGGKAQAYASVVATEVAKWRQVIKDSNIPSP